MDALSRQQSLTSPASRVVCGFNMSTPSSSTGSSRGLLSSGPSPGSSSTRVHQTSLLSLLLSSQLQSSMEPVDGEDFAEEASDCYEDDDQLDAEFGPADKAGVHPLTTVPVPVPTTMWLRDPNAVNELKRMHWERAQRRMQMEQQQQALYAQQQQQQAAMLQAHQHHQHVQCLQ